MKRKLKIKWFIFSVIVWLVSSVLCKIIIPYDEAVIALTSMMAFIAFSFGFIAYFNHKEYYKSLFINSSGKEVILLESLWADIETSDSINVTPTFYIKVRSLIDKKIILIEFEKFRRDYLRKYDI